MTAERRSSPHYPFFAFVEVTKLETGVRLTCRTSALSRRGCYRFRGLQDTFFPVCGEMTPYPRSTIDFQTGRDGMMLHIVGPPGPTFQEICERDRKSLENAPPLPRTERRIHKRMLVRLWNPENGRFEITPTVDINGHGARIVSRRSWQPNEQLLVQSIRGKLYSQVRVVPCRSLTGDSYVVVGLELYHPTEDWTTSGNLQGLLKAASATPQRNPDSISSGTQGVESSKRLHRGD